jgi:hypothetical protein
VPVAHGLGVGFWGIQERQPRQLHDLVVATGNPQMASLELGLQNENKHNLNNQIFFSKQAKDLTA